MKTLNISQNVPDEVFEQIQNLLKNEKGMWKPNKFEEYFLLNIGVESSQNDNLPADIFNFEIGNFYQTEAEAQAKVEWLKAVQRIKEYIAREFGNYTPDSTGKFDNCFTIYRDWLNKKFEFDPADTSVRSYSPFGYLRSAEDAEQLIKDCEADLKIVFNLK